MSLKSLIYGKKTFLVLLILALVLSWLVVNNSSMSGAAFKYLALLLVAIVALIGIKFFKG